MEGNYDSCWTIDGFMKRFDDLLKDHLTYINAYQKAEDEHMKLFGKFRYKSYDSFRQTRRDWVFKKKVA